MPDDQFLRSINLAFDVEHPRRLGHFRPTSKSIHLIDAVLDQRSDRAHLVVAPYGSGKSLASGFLLHAVQNEPDRYAGGEELLHSVAARIQEVDSALGSRLQSRVASDETGVGASLHGYYDRLVEAVRGSLVDGFSRAGLGREARSLKRTEGSESEQIAELIRIATEKLKQAGRDHLLIVWDEFGRHLERLIEEGRPGDLLSLQVLAEAANRAADARVSIVLLLHRSFMGYAGGLPPSVKREWAKIEGRFKIVQFVDDSLEMHRLLASIVSEMRPADSQREIDWREAAARTQAIGMFEGLETDSLAGMLEKAWPLEPGTLWLLPRIAARVAQHERTAFSFLHESDLGTVQTPAALCDYFRGEFQADGGPGGTQKAWLEVESALAKVPAGSVDAQVLKVAFLLGLGLGGERTRTTRARLEFAASSIDQNNRDEVRAAVARLLEQKLLIHRSQTDQVLVWHGTDVDLRGRLEDEVRQLGSSFELVPFLSKEAPPPVWRPRRHNAETGTPRYWESRYLTADGLKVRLEQYDLGLRDPGTDGEVFYVLPGDEAARTNAVELAKATTDPRVIMAVATQADGIRRLAAELAALLRMHQDHELLSQDPMVRSELDLLTDEVRQSLQPAVNQLLTPPGKKTRWFHRGREIELSGEVGFRSYLSAQMDDVFYRTPKILAEMVVRRRPTPVVINARKKVSLGLLERYGQENLGIEGDFADKAIFRSVFLRTGLYRRDQQRWRLAIPSELEDEGLSAVWQVVADFMTSPGQHSVQNIVHELLEPPYGVREGLIPLFLAAGLKAFPTPKALRSKAEYVSDVLPTTIEEVARSPEDYVLDVISLTEDQEEFLNAVLAHFAEYAPFTGDGEDLIRQTFDSIQGWIAQLPSSARSATQVGKETRIFRSLISESDPVGVLLTKLPERFGGPGRDLDQTFGTVVRAVQELEGVQESFVQRARDALSTALSARGISTGEDITLAGRRWAAFFPRELSLTELSPVARATLRQLRREHDSEMSLLNALALLVSGHAFHDWSEATIPEFERRLRTALEDIEHHALQAGQGPDVDPKIREGLVGLSLARLRLSLKQVAALLGQDEALDLVEEEINRVRQLPTQEVQ